MHYEELLAAYWLRQMQADVVLQQCMIGYCRAIWNTLCKYQLPQTTVVEHMCEDDESLRMRPHITNLRDDAYNKVTQWTAFLLTGMNVEVKQHHPCSAHNLVLYHIKYQLNPRPPALIMSKNKQDDRVQAYFDMQFVSAAAGAAHIFGDKFFH